MRLPFLVTILIAGFCPSRQKRQGDLAENALSDFSAATIDYARHKIKVFSGSKEKYEKNFVAHLGETIGELKSLTRGWCNIFYWETVYFVNCLTFT